MATALKGRTRIYLKSVDLENPIDYDAIYRIARYTLDSLSQDGHRLTLNLTSGTPAMAAIWALLGKGVFGCSLAQSSRQSGTEQVQLPFDISVEYLQQQDSRLKAIASDVPPLESEFAHIPPVSA